MYAINIKLTTRDGEVISLPWLRSALTLAKVHIVKSQVSQMGDDAIFAAEIHGQLSIRVRETLLSTLKLESMLHLDDSGHVWQYRHDAMGGLAQRPANADHFVLTAGGMLAPTRNATSNLRPPQFIPVRSASDPTKILGMLPWQGESARSFAYAIRYAHGPIVQERVTLYVDVFCDADNGTSVAYKAHGDVGQLRNLREFVEEPAA